MEETQLTISFKEANFPQQAQSSELVCQIQSDDQSVRLQLSQSSSIRKSSSLSIQVHLHQTLKSSKAFQISQLVTDENPILDTWLQFQTPEGQNFSLNFQFSLQSVFPIQNTTQTGQKILNCQYLDNLDQAISSYQKIEQIKEHLKSSLGNGYYKILDQAIRLRSRQSSQVKRFGNSPNSPAKTPARGKKSPMVSPSRTSTKRQKPQSQKQIELKIPSQNEISLQNFAFQDLPAMVTTVIGLQAKSEFFNMQSLQVENTEKIVKTSDEVIFELGQAMKETEQQYAQEDQKLNEFKQQILQENQVTVASALQSERKIKKSLFIRESLGTMVKNLKSKEIESLEADLEQSKKLHQFLIKSEEENYQIREKIRQDFIQHSENLKTLNKENGELATEKSQLLNKIRQESDLFDQFSKQNAALMREIQQIQEKLIVETDYKSRIQQGNNQIKQLQQAVENLQSGIKKIQKSVQSEQGATKQVQSSLIIQQDQLRIINSKLQSLLQQKSHQKIELTSQFDQSDQQVSHFTQMLQTKFKQNDHLLAKALAKFESTSHDMQTINNQIEYLSDSTLAFAQAATKQHRIFTMLSQVKQERVKQLQVMADAVQELKQKYPIYKYNKNDPLDTALGRYLNNMDETLVVPFVREEPGVYIFGTRRVLIKFERNKIQIKVGGGFLPIDQFIETYQYIEKAKAEAKFVEYSPQEKKMMAKWVTELVDNGAKSPEKIKDEIKSAVMRKTKTSCLGVKEPSPVRERTPSPKKRPSVHNSPDKQNNQCQMQ